MLLSIFTRPLFINPQGYLVIPELMYISKAIPFDFTNDSYSFKVNTSGKIEGRLLKAKDDYILHLDLYSIDGNCVLGEFYLNNSELDIDNFNLTQSNDTVVLLFSKIDNSNISYPGLIAAWSAKGKSNDDEDRVVLRDLTGNRHDITLNGFAFSGMSGYGGYSVRNLSIWTRYESLGNTYTPINSNKLNIYINDNRYVLHVNSNNFTSKSFTLRSDVPNLISSFGTFVMNQLDDYTYKFTADENTTGLCTLKCNSSYLKETVVIELLPEYPDALVFDGVDDYGINENMPILTDYTLIVKRNNFNNRSTLLNGIISKRVKFPEIACAFMFEKGGTWNFGGRNTDVPIIDSLITYQTSYTYNGIEIQKGELLDTDKILIGCGAMYSNGNAVEYSKLAFYCAYLFDRSLDEQEIKTFIRKYIDPEYLLPSEIPTPDCYYDFTNGDNTSETRDTIKDYSGNDNDAVAHNFAWNEKGSGYKDGALYFDGVDDYISLDAFDSGFKTIFVVCTLNVPDCFLYDQRDNISDNENAITTSRNQISYYHRNVSGKTYINGILNTSIKIEDTMYKKHLITSIFKATNINIPYIGSRIDGTINGNICLYKFLGFKEALTEDQIQYVIKKYNLLDGVDDIEVS